jgi:hypothetical protein
MLIQETKEFIKCAKDPVYFMNTYGYVFDITKNTIGKLTLFDFQEEVLRSFQANKNNIVLKSRQMGLSVVTSGYVCWKLLFNENERILIVANDGNGARRFLSSVKQFLDYLPKFLLPDAILTNNTQQIVLSNGSFCKAVASGKNAGRGETLTMLVLDETAFIDNADDIWMAAGPAMSSKDAKCIMISTPFGTGNLYHSMWVGSEKGENDFVRSKIHWTQHPFYAIDSSETENEWGQKYITSPWYEAQCEKFKWDRVKIAQEFDLSFEGSAAVVIDGHIIDRYEKNIDASGIKPVYYFDYKDPEYKFVKREGNFPVWVLPREKGNYIVAADVAGGYGADYSTIQVLDADNLEQVAEYQGKVKPDIFAEIIFAIGKAYNDAFVAVEGNNQGIATTLTLKKYLQYPMERIYHSKSARRIYVRHAGVEYVDANEDIPGFQTTSKTRPLLMNCLTKYMRDGLVKINSKRILQEFRTFVYTENDKPEHSKGYHDDLIIALAIALLIRDTEFDNVFKSKAFIKAMLDSFSYSARNQGMPTNTQATPNKNTTRQSGTDDISWLFGPTTG